MIEEHNPNHPVTRTVHDHWHKIVAILLSRPPYNGRTEITEEEIQRWSEQFDGYSVVIKYSDRKLTLWMVDKKEGQRLAKEAGGLPA